MTRRIRFEEGTYDLAVIGGGLAGVCASIAAARLGLKVALINDRPVLGGNSSSEIRVHVGGADHDFRWSRETGVIEELRIEDRFRNHSPIVSGKINSVWDTVLWEWTTREPNLDLFLNTSARKAVMEGDSRIAAVECDQLGTEKTLRIKADLFIDSSGDGAVAYSAGAQYRMGRESRTEFDEDKAPEAPDDKTMGSSILFGAVDMGSPVRFRRPAWAREYPTEDDLPFRWHERVTSGYWWIELGGEENTIYDNEEIRDELWRCLFGVWDHIKNKGDHGAENLALEWVGAVPGKRESRRFIGDYVLRQQDVESMARFPDAVAYGGWPIDIHPPGGIRQMGLPALMDRLPGPYSIPFRCLYSQNVVNLMMAGRNISVTHVALGTTRLQATGAVEGQAVGTAAYLCAKHGLMPRQICEGHIDELQQLLLKHDCYIPGVGNESKEDLARGRSVTATSEMSLEVTDLHSFVALDHQLGQIFPMSEDALGVVQLLLRCTSKRQDVTLRIRKAKHWTDTSSKEDIAVATASITKGEDWATFELGVDISPGFHWIILEPVPDVHWGFSKDEPVGVQRTESGPWRRLGGSYLFRTEPASKPYGPEHVTNGFTRPEDWTNLWISDPGLPLPQALEIQLDAVSNLQEVRLTFDTDLDDLVAIGPAPKCIKSYSLSCRTPDGWRELVAVGDNHHRGVVHRFGSVETDAIRVEALETWGSPSARIYEVRAYAA